MKEKGWNKEWEVKGVKYRVPLLGIEISFGERTEVQRYFGISSIINPPASELGGTSRVWLAPDTSHDIYIESIRVVHEEGMLSSVGSGGRHVDERFKYSFESGSDVVHLLDPYLTLDKTETREIGFDLTLSPQGYFGSVGGRVTAILNYRKSNGSRGQLPLIDQTEKRIFARINKDFIVDELKLNEWHLLQKAISIPYVIDGFGRVLGNDIKGNYNKLEFDFLKVDIDDYLLSEEIENKTIVESWYKKTKGNESLLLEELKNNNQYAIEISTFSKNYGIVRQMIELSDSDEMFHHICRSFAISELLGCDRDIHSFIDKNIQRIKQLRPSYYGGETDAIELLCFCAFKNDKEKFKDLIGKMIASECYKSDIEERWKHDWLII